MFNIGLVNRNATLPTPHWNSDGSYTIPLLAIGGELAVAAATANQPLTAAAPAAQYAYITNIYVIVTATAAAAASFSLLDATSGNVLHKFSYNAAGPTLHDKVTFRFEIPHRTAALAGQFFVTTTGAGITYSVQCNGFFTSLL